MKIVRRATLPVVGSVIAGRYRVMSLIGKGGMGCVYAAREVDSGAEVAVKALNPRMLSTTNLRRFRLEAEVAVAVRHRHLCDVRHLGVENGIPYIVMERLFGETVRARLRDTGALPAAEAIAISLQLLEALDAAHAAGIIHRDVKPGNVFITTERGRAPSIKVIDFGLAKLLPSWSPRAGTAAPVENQGLSSLTRTAVVPGTPYYLTPEQLSGCRDLDQRVDVWGAGLVLYEMLSGRLAYFGACHADLARAILYDSPPSVAAVRADVPKQIDAVLGRALAKDRNARYATAAEFRAALVDAWARHRAAGLARGRAMSPSRRRQKTNTLLNPGCRDATSSDFEIPIYFDT